MTSVDGRLVFFGGIAPARCGTGSLGCTGRPRLDGAVYDPVAMTWTRMAVAPEILASPQASAVDGSRLVYLSGRGYAQVVTYDVRTDTWRTLPPPLVKLRGNDLLAAGGGYAYVADQDDSGDDTQGQVQRVSLTTGRWTLLPRSEDPSRLAVRRLFVTPDGLLMAGLHGLDPADHDYRAQVEVLRGRHWHRYVAPDIQAAGYDFAWAHASLSVPFPESQAPGRSLDPVTGRWRSLPRQPGVAEGGWQWSPGQDAVTAGGDLVLSHGVVFNVATQRSVTLGRPAGATRSGSGAIVSGGVYVLDAHSRLWWQRL